ncbi:MAG: DUF3886 domain-containing protein [Brevibacillus sp.]|nr:DUF3886 domain-containing protein [Brevibacillus sp.]
MANRQKQRGQSRPQEAAPGQEKAAGYQLKERLNDDLLGKLKQMEREIKEARQREAELEKERLRREREERERSKSFAELLEEYDQKGIGKYS